MSLEDLVEEIYSCDECNACLHVCPTYLTTGNLYHTPVYRLKVAKNVLERKPIQNQMVESTYFCTQCKACENVCPKKIRIPKIVGVVRAKMFKLGYGPLPPHKKILESIFKNKNSVGGLPEKRWEWLPEIYKPRLIKDSSTLFFVGCLPSYLVKDAAITSVKVLDKVGVDFRFLEDEGCCGAPLVNFGDFENAEKIFKENLDKFDNLGIRKILVLCVGCYRTFRESYPEIAGEKVEVYHIAQILYELWEKGKLKFKKTGKTFTYHDPCHLGRFFGIYMEPRKLLESSGNLVEMDRVKENSFCCGADSGVRAAFKEPSVKMATIRIEEAEKKANLLTTTCPFCLFNLNYSAIKSGKNIQVKYFTEILLESLV